MKRHSRRQFLSTTTAGAITAFFSGYAKSTGSSPNDQIAVALIGINGIGMYHVRQIAATDGTRAVTLCGVKEKTGKTPQTTHDYRTIIDDKSIDAVVIATPHHWHCPIAVPALLAGKDVYIEKPASHVFHEGRLLVDAARK
ncbi:MAG: Gfo/Idh/MocA family protein, partial [Planctomycetota bacterium]